MHHETTTSCLHLIVHASVCTHNPMCMRSRESAHPAAVRLQCSCSLLLLESMPLLHHNACLESNHYLQTLLTDHASHLCVRSSHQAIHHASDLVSAVASAGRAAAIASCFFHRRLQPEVSRQESHRTGLSPKSVGGDVQTSDGERRVF